MIDSDLRLQISHDFRNFCLKNFLINLLFTIVLGRIVKKLKINSNANVHYKKLGFSSKQHERAIILPPNIFFTSFRSIPPSSVDTHRLYLEKENDPYDVVGYRIVDLNYIFGWITQLTLLHSRFCKQCKLIIYDEKCEAMISTLVIMCSTCKSFFSGKSENPANKYSIRKSLVWGTIGSGQTHKHTEELFAHLDMPFISNHTFNKDLEELHHVVKDAAKDSMKKARDEEKKLTTVKDANGIPVSRVIVDGGWPVRAYGNRYKSRSGSGKKH